MQEEGAGSFWATFGGGSNGAEASALEKVLQTPNCSVEALLDEEEVIQEFKTGNPKLVARLSEPDAIKVLMDCITEDPPPEAGSARCYRYPFVAVELMTCAPPKFLELLVSSESNAMDLLWSFLTRDPSESVWGRDDEVSPVLAGYFSRTAAAILSKYKQEVLDYLRARGPDQLLEEFLERIHLRSLAELLARLLSGESENEVVFQTNDLVARFLSRWQEDSNSEAHENITLVLAELLNQKDSLFWIEDLTRQLTEPSTVQFLIDHISGQPSVGVSPAMSLLTTVIVHTSAGLKDGTEVCASTPSLSPLSAPRLAEEMPSMNLDEPVASEAAAAKAVSTPQTTLQSTPSEWMERRRARLMQEVAGHFPSFRELLDQSLKPAQDGSGALAMPQGSIRAVGGTALEVISLIATLSRSGLEVILEAILKNELLPRCLQVFFEHPWSSLLHNCVKQLVMEVLSGADPLRQQLIRQLLKEARLGERIAEEYAAEAAWDAKKQKHARVGYMGHLFLMAGALQEAAGKWQEAGELLNATSGWSDVVQKVEATRKLHNEQLGGGVPASDRGLASSSARVTTSSEREGEGDQVAACPAWSKRVLSGTGGTSDSGNFLAAEPIDLQERDPDPPERPAVGGPAPVVSNEVAVPNGQGGSVPSSPPEDAFNPDFAAFETAPSSPSWAAFPDVASGAPPAAGEPSFASFATDWPTPETAAAPSESWAAFAEPPATPPPVPVAENHPRQQMPSTGDSQLFPSGGATFPVPSRPPPPAQAPPPPAPALPVQREAEKPKAAPAPKAKEKPSTPLSEELGAENLFALIGEGFAPPRSSRPEPAPASFPTPAISTVPKQPSATVSSPWPPSPTPWSPGGYGMPMPSPAPAASGSWIGDFDPFADSKGTPAIPKSGAASKVTPQSAPSTSSELAFLDFQWPEVTK